ncbi:MAG: Protein translocase subunit SecF [candidate division CPR2 bacterium GW2011_GWC1_39_9]|nr:MAG: Protein translocase subunit SecF [candidate division CPR2 bacterium GW2011_GWC1_39_9]
MNIMGKRKYLYLLSLAVIIPGVISLSIWKLKLSIDFTGGSVTEVSGTYDESKVRSIAEKNGYQNIVLTKSDNVLILKTKEISDANHRKFTAELIKEIPSAKESRFESVGPSVSKTLARNAFYSVALASFFIVIYLSMAFKKVSKPLNSWEFGLMAVVALIHDVLVVVGIFSILGHFFNVEIDSMFITAILTIIGFSVHDTIVVYDRIREKVIKDGVDNFEKLVNKSLLETLSRSVNTSLTVILTLLILFLFGGESIKIFVLALLVGIATGTYSSIFVASALLVDSFKFKGKLKTKNA